MKRSSATSRFFLASLVALGAALLIIASGCSSGSGRGESAGVRGRPAPVLAIPENGWSAEKRAAHLLNRLAYGPSSGDLAGVARLGLSGWTSSQMSPAAVPDETVEAKLHAYPSLGMSIARLAEAYPAPRLLARQKGNGKGDPAAAAPLADPGRLPRRIGEELVAAKVIRAVESRRQLQEVLTDFWFNHFNVFVEKGADRWLVGAYERDAIRPHVLGSFRELLEATATHPAMLFYLDNWLSVREGFTPGSLETSSVAARKGFGETGRGVPRDMMPGPAAFPPGAAKPRAAGPNENYARELLELHTMGVDGGYTQDDVREVARCFTGWSIDRPRQGGGFVFREAAHDRGRKLVLGHVLAPGGGKSDGEAVLDILASHPATARFVARKLCTKFVADEPPEALVARVAATFLATKGDLRATYAAIFGSKEFWSDEAFASKTKTPLELAASAIRAAGGSVEDPAPLAREIAKMGEPLYRCQPPTGYDETAGAWVGTGALLSRLNFALALASGRLPGVRIDRSRLPSAAEPEEAVDLLAAALVKRPLSPGTRATILTAVERDAAPTPTAGRRPLDVPKISGLLLGSPEFQKQ